MSKPETIMIDSVEYIRADSITDTSGDTKIVVLDRGFVYVGNVSVKDDFVVILNARNIRIWGTTKGLGELVSGPLPRTKLDSVGTVRAPLRAVISLIDVDGVKWNAF